MQSKYKTRHWSHAKGSTNAGVDPDTVTAEEEEAVEELVQEWYYALAFRICLDQTHLGCLLKDLEIEYTQGHDKYPKT